MIVEEILRGFLWMVSSVLDLLPSWQLPAFVTGSGPGTLSHYSGAMGAFLPPFGAWVPIPLLLTLMPIMLAAMLVSFGIKTTMMIVRLLRG